MSLSKLVSTRRSTVSKGLLTFETAFCLESSTARNYSVQPKGAAKSDLLLTSPCFKQNNACFGYLGWLNNVDKNDRKSTAVRVPAL